MTSDVIGIAALTLLIVLIHYQGWRDFYRAWRFARRHGPQLTQSRLTRVLDAHNRAEADRLLLPEICGCSVRFSNEADRGEFTWCAAHCPDCRRERHGHIVPCAIHDAAWVAEMERRLLL